MVDATPVKHVASREQVEGGVVAVVAAAAAAAAAASTMAAISPPRLG
jgi:hypothetical protein